MIIDKLLQFTDGVFAPPPTQTVCPFGIDLMNVGSVDNELFLTINGKLRDTGALPVSVQLSWSNTGDAAASWTLHYPKMQLVQLRLPRQLKGASAKDDRLTLYVTDGNGNSLEWIEAFITDSQQQDAIQVKEM